MQRSAFEERQRPLQSQQKDCKEDVDDLEDGSFNDDSFKESGLRWRSAIRSRTAFQRKERSYMMP
jgi:hypothetical protein